MKQSIQQTQLLKQNVIVAILDSLNNLRTLEGEMIEAEKAIELYNTLFINEMKKLSSGYGSVFEMLNFETSWTSAELSLISLYQSYFEELANLRYQTGTLLISDDGQGTITFEDVTKAPLVLDCYAGL